MFGGLELKGSVGASSVNKSVGNNGDAVNSESGNINKSSNAAAMSGSSAFSFLNAFASPPAPAPAQSAILPTTSATVSSGSAFSFMQNLSNNGIATTGIPVSAMGGSGGGLLSMKGSSDASVSTSKATGTATVSATGATYNDGAPSGFSFLVSSSASSVPTPSASLGMALTSSKPLAEPSSNSVEIFQTQHEQPLTAAPMSMLKPLSIMNEPPEASKFSIPAPLTPLAAESSLGNVGGSGLSSAFSFLSNSAASSSSGGISSVAATDESDFVGAGVSFGSATSGTSTMTSSLPPLASSSVLANSKSVKKKRTRTAIIGTQAHQSAAAHTTATTTAAVTTTSTTSTMSTMSTATGSTGHDTKQTNQLLMQGTPTRSTIPQESERTNARESALEASRRAEAFMSEKIKQLANDEHQTHQHHSRGREDAQNYDQGISGTGSVDSEDSEGIVAVARAAAAEAHKMTAAAGQSKIMGRTGSGSLLSGLFRARTSPPTSQNNSSRNLVGGGSGSGGLSGMTPPPPLSGIRKSFSKTAPTTTTITTASTAPISAMSELLDQGNSSSATTLDSATELLRQEQLKVQRNIAEQQSRFESTAATNRNRVEGDGSYEHHGNPIAVVPVPLPPSYLKKPPTISTLVGIGNDSATVDILSKPTPPTPKQKFNAMISRFRERIERAMAEVSRLRQHRTGLLEEQNLTIAKERLASQQKAAAEAQQMAAAEAEEFELADEMSVIIEKYARETIEYQAIIENIQRALRELEVQKQQCIDQVSSCFREIRTELMEFHKLTESDDNKDAMEKLHQFSAVSKVLSAESERLQQDWKHIERDAQQVADERKEVENAISLQSGEFESSRDATNAKLAAVEEEIEELRRQLADRQATAAKLRTEAAGYEESILKVRVKFARQLTRVQKKEMEIHDTQREWENEKANFEMQRQNHEKQMSAHSEMMLERDQLLDTLRTEIELATTFEELVESKEVGLFASLSISPLKAASTTGMGNGKEKCKKQENEVELTSLVQLQADVVKAEAARNDAHIAMKAASSALSNLEEEVKRLETSIPHLEEMKKAAASRRDFKLAGNASKEIKEASARLKNIRDGLLLDEAKERVQLAEMELEKRSQDLQEATQRADEMERQTDLRSMYDIANAIKKIQSIQVNKSKKQKNSSRSTLSIHDAGLYVLDCQIKSLLVEGQNLGHKFGTANRGSSESSSSTGNKWDEIYREVVGLSHENDNPDDIQSRDDCQQAESSENEEALSSQACTSNTITQELTADDTRSSIPNDHESTIEPICEGTAVTTSTSSQQLLEEERLRQFLDLTKRLKHVEDALEQAVAEDDFDQAAVLDETLQQLMNDLTTLNMSDEEMEAALMMNTSNDDNNSNIDQVDGKNHFTNINEGSTTGHDNELGSRIEVGLEDNKEKNTADDDIGEVLDEVIDDNNKNLEGNSNGTETTTVSTTCD